MIKYLRVFFALLFVGMVLGLAFGLIDVLRVHNDEDPIFAFSHRIACGENYSAKIDTGLGYKIIRYSIENEPEQIKVGSIFLSENIQDFIAEAKAEEDTLPIEKEGLPEMSGESSGEEASGDTILKEVKMTTFGEKYTNTILLEGMEEDVYAQNIHSKMGYSMEYYYELFDYTGYEEHDVYTWKFLPSGDTKATMTITNVTEEKAYLDTLEKMEKDSYTEFSGDKGPFVEKNFYKTQKENEIEKMSDIYLIVLPDLKLKVEMELPVEAVEGIGAYMNKMMRSIHTQEN